VNTRILATVEDFSRYNAWVQGHPEGNLWQSLEWKRYQEALGREVRVYVVEDSSKPSPYPSPLKGRGCSITASALVVIDRTTGGLSTWDIPRGPLHQLSGISFQVSGVDAAAKLLDDITHDAKKDRCLALFLSPSTPLEAGSWKLEAGTRNEQPEATRIIDLTKSEEEILAQMHPKGRYNIKVAQKNGVQVEQADDVEAFYDLLQQTAWRDGFRILPLKAYKAFLERLPGSFLLLAYPPPSPFVKGEGQGERVEREGAKSKPIAGLIGIIWPQNLPLPRPLSLCGRRGEETDGFPPTTGIYYYGASDYTSRSLMAPYLLQWEAMRLCKTKGCTRYDLLGVVPSTMPLTLTLSRGERGFLHPWAGISAFKEKFGGTVATYPPEQQIVLRPMLWKMLQWKRQLLG